MATKAETAEAIGAITGTAPDPDKHTADELAELLDEAKAGQDDKSALEKLKEPGGVTRRRINRGSTRRINRATEKLVEALNAFAAEIDTQIYLTDKDGKRTGKCDVVEATEQMAKDLPNKMAEYTTPPDKPAADDSDE